MFTRTDSQNQLRATDFFGVRLQSLKRRPCERHQLNCMLKNLGLVHDSSPMFQVVPYLAKVQPLHPRRSTSESFQTGCQRCTLILLQLSHSPKRTPREPYDNPLKPNNHPLKTQGNLDLSNSELPTKAATCSVQKCTHTAHFFLSDASLVG